MNIPENDYTIVIKYNSDPTKMIDDHDSENIYLTEINSRRFDDIYEAIKFLSDCNSPITTIEDILDYHRAKLKLILPEKNIKIKHQASFDIDIRFDNESEEWE